MRSILCAASLALAVSLGAATTAAAQSAPKLAYIRSQALLAEAPGRAEAEAAFEREMGGYRQAVQRMGDSLNTMITAYNNDEISLSPAAKETRQKSIREREEQYQQRVRSLEQQIEERLAGAPGGAEAEAAFGREMGGYRQAVQRMGDSLNTMITAYNNDEISLSPAAKETRQKSIREREEQYQQRVRSLEQQIEERR